jgi:hypothetical protein
MKTNICGIGIDSKDFPKGTLYRTTFDKPVTIMAKDIVRKKWIKNGLKLTVNGVIIPSKTEIVK